MNDIITRDDFLHHMELGKKAMALLPEDPGHIARYLMRQGVKAECGSASRCALAEHLTTQAPLPQGYKWSVTTDNFSVVMSKEGHTREDFSHFNNVVKDGPFDPESVQLLTHEQTMFVRQFDNGEYPSLVKE